MGRPVPLENNELQNESSSEHHLASGTKQVKLFESELVRVKPITLPITFMGKKKYKLAKLYDCGGDLKKEWYVWFEYLNPDTGEYKRFIRKGGINKEKTVKLRRWAAEGVINAVNKHLTSGWSPFGTPERFSGSGATGDGGVLFFNNAKKVIGKLKSAKKVLIEAPLYGRGKKQWEFSVSDLKWE